MSIMEGIICGGLAGFFNCILVTPSELIKCRMQIEYDPEFKEKHHMYKMIKRIIYQEKLRGLYTGNVATILREIPAYSVFSSIWRILLREEIFC